MMFPTYEGVLHPDGTVQLTQDRLPGRAVRVLVTLLESEDDSSLSEPGDYLERLEDYEDRLARGEIRWQ